MPARNGKPSEVVEKVIKAVDILCSREWWNWEDDPRFLLWMATYGRKSEGESPPKESAVEWLADRFKQKLLESDFSWLEKLGRAAADPKLPRISRSSGLFSKQYRVWREVERVACESGEIPRTKEVSAEIGIPIKTVQRAYEILAKQAGLELDGRYAFSIYK